MLSNNQKLSFAELFASRRPTSEGDADVYLEVESFQMFAPLMTVAIWPGLRCPVQRPWISRSIRSVHFD